MIQVRKSEARGHVNHGWLDSHHTFSFGGYYDPKFAGFRSLVVINEDRVKPGQGFGKHGHEDMEIISYVLEGELAHRDSLGTGSVIRSGEVQRMSAGRGVRHSEFNHSQDTPVHFLQIWILPREQGIDPSYEQKSFPAVEKCNRLRLLVSPTGEQGSLRMHQDARLYSTLLDEGKELNYELKPGRHGWVQVARGSLEVNGTLLEEGDGASISDEANLRLFSRKASEALVFDLP